MAIFSTVIELFKLITYFALRRGHCINPSLAYLTTSEPIPTALSPRFAHLYCQRATVQDFSLCFIHPLVYYSKVAHTQPGRKIRLVTAGDRSYVHFPWAPEL